MLLDLRCHDLIHLQRLRHRIHLLLLLQLHIEIIHNHGILFTQNRIVVIILLDLLFDEKRALGVGRIEKTLWCENRGLSLELMLHDMGLLKEILNFLNHYRLWLECVGFSSTFTLLK